MLIDTHAHLNAQEFEADAVACLDRCAAAGVGAVICVGYDVETSRRAVSLAESDVRVFATVGVHPNYVAEAREDWTSVIRDLAQHPRVVAIGETGLDNFRAFTPPPAQRWAFGWHLELGAELNLPVVVHDRDADADIRASLAGRGTRGDAEGVTGVLHSFCGDEATMHAGLEAGFAISFSGMVTFKNKGLAHLAKLVRRVPDARLLVETDCPYLAPDPHRGRRNEPAFVLSVASRVAELRGAQLTDIARVTTANACRVFPRMGSPDSA